MGYSLSTQQTVEHELLPAVPGRDAVKVVFNALPSPLSLRAARRAAHAVLTDGMPNAVERAGDAFSAALIRHNIVSWTGIDVDDAPVEPTHDMDVRGEDGEVSVQSGTITFFLREPRLFEAADQKYVLPWTELDAEKNGYAPSQNGTSAGATPGLDTASSAATQDASAAAGTKKPAKRRAHTNGTKPKPTKAKPSGS